MSHVLDTRSRPLRDLRISVTDRCNFRCTYCMPKEIFGRDFAFLPRAQLLTFEEITRLARAFACEGVLKAAGLARVTVSLDALDDRTFAAMNDVAFPVARVLDGIDAAAAAGLTPVKINMVVKRGVNDHRVVEMAERFRGSGHILRLIEYMDVGTTNRWRMDDVVPAAEIAKRLSARWPLEPLQPNYAGEVASRYRYRDYGGEIGIIASVTQPFCGACTRARLSADGKLYTCLFAAHGQDLRALLRDDDATDDQLSTRIRSIWARRADRYSELRDAQTQPRPKIEMSYIGG
jgi:GTP 3',8-cyclase